MQEDIEVLESALRDIAHAVIQDAESRDASDVKQALPHIHLSSGAQISQRSPKRSARSSAIPALAESTISAVRAAQQGTASNNAQAMRHRGDKRSDAKYQNDRTDISIGHVSFAMHAA